MPTLLPPESDDAIARRARRAERQSDISAIRADLDRLTALVERYVETQDKQQGRLDELISVLDRVRGGIAVLAWIGGVIAVVGSVASWVIDHWPSVAR